MKMEKLVQNVSYLSYAVLCFINPKSAANVHPTSDTTTTAWLFNYFFIGFNQCHLLFYFQFTPVTKKKMEVVVTLALKMDLKLFVDVLKDLNWRETEKLARKVRYSWFCNRFNYFLCKQV